MRIRHLKGALALFGTAALFAGDATAQQLTVQALLERGAFEEAVQRAEREPDNPESTYLAAQALNRMDNDGGAVEQYNRLRETGDDSWKAIGESGALLTEGNMDGAKQAAQRAVAANPENPYAHYQLGMVAHRQSDYNTSAAEFRRAVDLKGDLAYAHYYAGLAQQRLKNIARMSEHFEAFMRLAPDAPERTAVAAILRTARPR